MAIKRRIFKKAYKPQNFNTITKAANEIKFKINRKLISKILKVKKYKKNVLHRSLNVRHWNYLTTAAKYSEQLFVQHDIKTFANKYIPGQAGAHKQLSFRAYLPKIIWNKMTKEQRKAHLRKRDAINKKNLQIKKRRQNISAKVYFTNFLSRPILKNMRRKDKIIYLRAIIARAKIRSAEISTEIAGSNISKTAPYKNLRFSIRHFLNFRKSLSANKKIAIKHKHLVPKKISKDLVATVKNARRANRKRALRIKKYEK